jgi:hypothetical protein
MVNSTDFLALVCIPAAITIAYAAHEEITHKPQEYKDPHLVFLMFIIIAPPLAAVPPFTGFKHKSYPIFFSLYGIGISVLFFTSWMGSRMAKSMVETGEVDAMAWLFKIDVDILSRSGILQEGRSNCQSGWSSLPTQAFEITYASSLSSYNLVTMIVSTYWKISKCIIWRYMCHVWRYCRTLRTTTRPSCS